MASNVTLAKGEVSVTINTDTVADNYVNKLFTIVPTQSAANQALGPQDSKVVDLLRITRQIIIKGAITPTASKSAQTVKDDLVSIHKGAGVVGGVVTLTYDGDTIKGFVEKLNFSEKAFDEPADYEANYTAYQDIAKYEVSITFIEGISI